MKSNFNDWLNRLLKDEGGYSNLAADPGGPTNFGITLADYRRYINSQGTALDVKNMRVEDAKSIYRTKYWNALNCDQLASGVDYTAFDYGVNSGLGRPRKALQQFKSLSGVSLIDAINNERMAFLRSLHTFPVFGKGWTRRVNGVREYSKFLATKKVVPTGPIAGTTITTIAAGSALSQYCHNHQTAIIIASIAMAIAIGFAVHYFMNKNK